MPPPSSSLSIVCDHIRDFIRTGIDGVTKEDVQRLAQKYLDLNKSAIVITLPKK